MKVWLDDQAVRDPEGWVVVRTADEAIALLIAGGVEAISLDHDLGDIRYEPYPREVTGMDVVRWMVSNNTFPKVVNVHSLSPRAKAMVADLVKAAPDGVKVRMWRYDAGGAVAKDLEKLITQQDYDGPQRS